MLKYAFVVTCSGGLLPGLNALLNGLKYYGNGVDFHLLYSDDGTMLPYIESVRKNGFYPNFFAVDVMEHAKQIGTDSYHQSAVFYLATHRYSYAASLKDYDAVVLCDADAAVVNNIMHFYDIVATTDLIIMPNNNVGVEYDWCTPELWKSAAVPPLHCNPLFFNPVIYGELIGKLPMFCQEHQVDDMVGINYMLLTEGLMRTKVFVQPNFLWVNTIADRIPLAIRDIGGTRFIVTSSNDRLWAFHGRWWYASNMNMYSVEPTTKADLVRNWNIRCFWETYYFFNTQCYHRIEWNEQQWGAPDMFSKIGSGKRWG